MNNKTNNPLRKSIHYILDTLTMGAGGAGKSAVQNIQNLHTLSETLSSTDGLKTQIKSIRVSHRIYSESPFCVTPTIIQTIGTVTDTVDLTSTTIDGLLDSVTNDVLGFQVYPSKYGKRVPSNDSTNAAGTETSVETTQIIPQKVLNLLNKEAETERLQDIIYALVFLATENSQAFSIRTFIEVEFSTIRRDIVIR